MPLKTPCKGNPSCNALTDTGYCKKHEKPKEDRESGWKRYPPKTWDRERAYMLSRQPVCQCNYKFCKHDDGPCMNPSSDVDHIIPKWLLDSDKHLQCLCKGCHSRKTRWETRWLAEHSASFATPEFFLDTLETQIERAIAFSRGSICARS